jgi:formylglycine-generating enzyme required for sulfatase activity
MLLRAALALLLVFPASAAGQDIDQTVPAVVKITGTRGDTPVQGSGFVVRLERDKAVIVTAAHVIEGVEQLAVRFAADLSESFPVGGVYGMDAGNPRGLAVFEVRGAFPAGVTALGFDTEVALRRGEDLYVEGFPEHAKTPLTLRRTFAGPDGNFLQLDPSAGEGLSGAPVLRGGRVVGVVTDVLPQLTFAVKALVVRDAVLGWGVKLGGEAGREAASAVPQIRPMSPPPAPCVSGKESEDVDGMTFVRICAGTFTMGSAANDRRADADEMPAHEVTLSEFWIGKTEVTNEQYRRIWTDHQGDAQLPAATGVQWPKAKAACEHFGGRLPTEAEWEYAARAGSQTAWSFGDDEKKLQEYAWYSGNAGGIMAHPVATKRPNAWGLHDMHGNASEWVGDWYGPYASAAQKDPTGPRVGDVNVVRGGALDVSPLSLRSANRTRIGPGAWIFGVGFRCVRSPHRQP